ncbi:hypothetical protein [Chitiniphilus shinanonensis]|uniref:hypothetical protein n=1 Tax=Chitiniphilus shinanonensis TaxID=553088 RepID=UPI003032DC73
MSTEAAQVVWLWNLSNGDIQALPLIAQLEAVDGEWVLPLFALIRASQAAG